MVFSTDAFSARTTGDLIARLLDWVAPGLSQAAVAAINTAARRGMHLFEYAVLAVLLRPAVHGSGGWAFALAVLAAAIDETHQATTASRGGSIADVALDALGAALGLTILALVRRWRNSAMTRASATRALCFGLTVLVAGLLPAACAGLKTHRLDLRYTPGPPPAVETAARAMPVVGLAPTRDARGLADPAAIGRRVTSDGTIEPMVPDRERPEAIVTEALRSSLAMAGYTVRPLPAWDLRAESLDPSWGDVVLGTELLEFWTEARSRDLMRTRLTSRARVRLVLADPKAGRIVWTNAVESAVQDEVNFFETKDASTAASEALTAAIRSLAGSAELRDRLQALR